MWVLRLTCLMLILLLYAELVTANEQHSLRIITLTPELTELAYAAGAGSYIIAVGKDSDFPIAAQSLPVIANFPQVDIEAIVNKHPDIVIADDSIAMRLVLKKLQHFGIKIFTVKLNNLNDIPKAIENIAQLVGTEKAAQQSLAEFKRHYAYLQQYTDKKPVSVFFQIWSEPLLTVNDKTLIGQVITLCGGKNIFGKATVSAPAVGIEAVLTANPQVIISSESNHSSLARQWLHWSYLQAVRQNQLFFVSPDLLQRYSPRALQGAEAVCKILESVRSAKI